MNKSDFEYKSPLYIDRILSLYIKDTQQKTFDFGGSYYLIWVFNYLVVNSDKISQNLNDAGKERLKIMVDIAKKYPELVSMAQVDQSYKNLVRKMDADKQFCEIVYNELKEKFSKELILFQLTDE